MYSIMSAAERRWFDQFPSPKITLFFIKGQNFLLCLRSQGHLNLDDFQLCPLLVDDWDYSELIFLGNQGRIQMVPSITVDCQLELIDPTIINLQPKDDSFVINAQINDFHLSSKC